MGSDSGRQLVVTTVPLSRLAINWTEVETSLGDTGGRIVLVEGHEVVVLAPDSTLLPLDSATEGVMLDFFC